MVVVCWTMDWAGFLDKKLKVVLEAKATLSDSSDFFPIWKILDK